MSLSSPSSRSRTNSALRSSSAIVAIRSFAALSEASLCSSALSSVSSRSIATSRSVAEHPTPPRSPHGHLSAWGVRARPAPALLLLGLLGGFSPLPDTVQLPTQLIALPFCLFASPALLGHSIAQRGLRHLAPCSLVAELVPGLCCGGPGL